MCLTLINTVQSLQFNFECKMATTRSRRSIERKEIFCLVSSGGGRKESIQLLGICILYAASLKQKTIM